VGKPVVRGRERISRPLMDSPPVGRPRISPLPLRRCVSVPGRSSGLEGISPDGRLPWPVGVGCAGATGSVSSPVGRPSLPRGSTLSAGSFSFHLPRTDSSSCSRCGDPAEGMSPGASTAATAADIEEDDRLQLLGRRRPGGYVRFSVDPDGEVEITPYASIYGEHPKGFHFDSAGEKVRAKSSSGRSRLAQAAAGIYLRQPLPREDVSGPAMPEQQSAQRGAERSSSSSALAAPPPSPRETPPSSSCSLEIRRALQQMHRTGFRILRASQCSSTWTDRIRDPVTVTCSSLPSPLRSEIADLPPGREGPRLLVSSRASPQPMECCALAAAAPAVEQAAAAVKVARECQGWRGACEETMSG